MRIQTDTQYIRQLVTEGEHCHQDFKFEISDARKIARSISAFANTEGGRLLVGVKDNGKIAGIRSEEEIYMIEAAASMYCQPKVQIETHTYIAEGRTVLNIDPGMAFGTGGHETTRLVLEAMEAVITPDTAVLDVGCGSGILSIAALLLGAQSALAVDIDALAVKTAIENGERSGLTAPRYTVVEGDLVDKVNGQFDLVVANIVADAIIMLSPAVKPFVKNDGVYIVSGIIDTREAEVVEALNRCGFVIEHRYEQRGWLCLVCRHA